MYQVKVVSEVENHAARMIWKLNEIPAIMLRHVRRAVDLERNSKRYQDRTGAMVASTVGTLLWEAPDFVQAEFAIRVNYASMVKNAGFSDFDEIADMTDRHIQIELESMHLSR
jgi:hypothetical protein